MHDNKTAYLLILRFKLHFRMSFPNKEERTKCWNYRDEYWNCLDEGKSETECKKFREQYEKFCPALWVSFLK